MSGPAVEHTPTPWSVYEDMDRIAAPTELFVRTSTMGQYKSASLTNDRGEFHNPADAAFIVEACNSHASHLLALAKVREALEQIDLLAFGGTDDINPEKERFKKIHSLTYATLLSLPPQTVTKP